MRLVEICSACGVTLKPLGRTALGVVAASFFEVRKKDIADDPTPIFHRGSAQRKLLSLIINYLQNNMVLGFA